MTFSERLLKIRYNLSRISRAYKAAKIEITKPENSLKGDIFEDYCRKYLFPKRRYKLVHRTPAHDSKDFNEMLLTPDFIFSCQDYKFAIEAKFRSSLLDNDCLRFCRNADQLNRYKKFEEDNQIPVYILIGLSNSPFNPESLIIIPVKKVFNHILPVKYLDQNYVSKGHPIEVIHLKTALSINIRHGNFAVF